MAMCGCAFIRLVYRFCRTVRRANQLGGTLFTPSLNKSPPFLWLRRVLDLSSEVPRIVFGTIGPLGHDLFELESTPRNSSPWRPARSLRLSTTVQPNMSFVPRFTHLHRRVINTCNCTLGTLRGDGLQAESYIVRRLYFVKQKQLNDSSHRVSIFAACATSGTPGISE